MKYVWNIRWEFITDVINWIQLRTEVLTWIGLLSKNKKYIVIIYMNKYNGGIIYALKSYQTDNIYIGSVGH